MKLSTMFAKLTQSKGKVLSMLGGLAIAGAALTAAAPAANAQVAFGVTVGPRYYAPRPVYVAPGYAGYGYGYRPYAYGYGYGPDYWAHRRYEDWRAREWREHQAWDYRHGYYGRTWR